LNNERQPSNVSEICVNESWLISMKENQSIMYSMYANQWLMWKYNENNENENVMSIMKEKAINEMAQCLICGY
jgi:hypothetical protein